MRIDFSTDFFLDLVTIFGFLTVTDDMIDNSTSRDTKKVCLHDIKKFLLALFDGRCSKNRFKWVNKAGTPVYSIDKIDWKYFEDRLAKEQLAIFRAFSRIADYLPHEPFYGMLEHWKDWDVQEKVIKNEQDLVEFGSKVYGCVTDVIIYTYYHKTNQSPDGFGPTTEFLCEQIRRLSAVCYFFPGFLYCLWN